MKQLIVKYWWVILIFILFPIIVWGLTLIQAPYIPYGYHANESDWLSFFGGYLGACITVLFTLYILSITINQNHESLRKTIQMGINTAKFSDANNEINIIRKVLNDNYRLLDYQRFSKALGYIKTGNNNYAKQLLLDINRDIEMVASSSDIYLKAYNETKTDVEQQYFDTFEQLICDFGLLVNDFNFVTSIPDFLSTSPTVDDFYTYVKYTYMNLQSISSMSSKVEFCYISHDNFFTLFLKLPKRDNIKDILIDVDEVIIKRVKSMINEHTNKTELFDASQNLLKYKEAEAKKILTDKLEN